MDGTICIANSLTLNCTFTGGHIKVIKSTTIPEITTVQCVAESALTAGSYFLVDTMTQNYYVWYHKNEDFARVTSQGIQITSDLAGPIGNTYTVTLDGTGADDCELAVSVDGVDITVTLGKTGSDLSSTTAEVVAILNSNEDSAALIAAVGGDATVASAEVLTLTGGVNETGTDPAISGRTGVRVNIRIGDTAANTALATDTALTMLTVTRDDDTLTFSIPGNVVDIVDGTVATGFTITATQQGEYKTLLYNNTPYMDVNEILSLTIDDDGNASILVRYTKKTFVPDSRRPTIKTAGKYIITTDEEVRTISGFVDLT